MEASDHHIWTWENSLQKNKKENGINGITLKTARDSNGLNLFDFVGKFEKITTIFITPYTSM